MCVCVSVRAAAAAIVCLLFGGVALFSFSFFLEDATLVEFNMYLVSTRMPGDFYRRFDFPHPRCPIAGAHVVCQST